MPYDEPNYTVRREQFAGEAGGAATTEYCKFRAFRAARLKQVHAFLTVAGTATTHGFNVFKGTTSVGTIALSTTAVTAAQVNVTKYGSGVLDVTLAAGDQISVKSLADAAGKAHIVYEFEITPDAVQS
jgi:hypothetical protein